MTLLRAAVPPRTHREGLYTSPVARKNIVRLDVLRQLVRCEHLAFVSSVPGVVSERDMIVPLINLKEVNSGLVQLDKLAEYIKTNNIFSGHHLLILWAR